MAHLLDLPVELLNEIVYHLHCLETDDGSYLTDWQEKSPLLFGQLKSGEGLLVETSLDSLSYCNRLLRAICRPLQFRVGTLLCPAAAFHI